MTLHRNLKATIAICACLFLFLTMPTAVFSQEEAKEAEEVSIQDNSFLIEEAYNQEKGIIQHIFNWVPSWDVDRGVRHRETNFLFTQEWPIFSQKHQFSYSIPVNRFTDQSPGGPIYQAEGVGDILLNYRYQLMGGTGQELSMAPRCSLIFPSGDENLGIGKGKLGYQFLLPVSKEYDHWCFHFNAGYTVTPEVMAGVDPELDFPGQTLNGYLLGGSTIYKFMPNFHFVLETLALWNENLLFEGTRERTMELYVSPGVRWAPYTENDVQWVLGLAAPIGASRDARDVSLFFYMSFEHPFTIQPKEEKK